MKTTAKINIYLKRILFLVLIISFSNDAFSQGLYKKIDSLGQFLKTAKEDTSKVITLNFLGGDYWLLGDFDNALKYARESLALSEKLNFRKGIARAYSSISLVYGRQGNFSEALKYTLASLKIDEDMGDKRGIADCYNNIGNIYYQSGNLTECLVNYNAALKIREEIGDKRGSATTYNNIGNFYIRKNNFPAALKNYSTSLKITEKAGDKEGMSRAYNNIGNVYKTQSNYTKALDNYLKSLQISEETGNKFMIASAEINMGQMCTSTKKFTEAKEHLNKALHLSQQIGGKDLVMEAYRSLTHLDSTMGNYKDAYLHELSWMTARDSIFNEESNKQISQLKIQYETEKKDREIEAMNKDRLLNEAKLKRQQTINNAAAIGVAALMLIAILGFWVYRNNRRRNESELKHQVTDVEMKSLRSQLNPHFIFNAMNTTQSMYERDKMEGDRFLHEYSSFMRNMLNSSELPEHSIDSEMQLIQEYFNIESARFENRPVLNIIIDESIDRYSVLIPSLLIQPLIENSSKYCLAPNRGNGLLQVIFRKEGNALVCRVEDKGFEQETFHPFSGEVADDQKPHGGMITLKRLELFNKKYKFKEGGIKAEPLKPGTAVILRLAYYSV